MLCKSGMASGRGVRFVGSFKSLAAVSLLALTVAAAVAPAQAADFGGKVDHGQSRDESGFMSPAAYDWSGIYVGANLGGGWTDADWSVEGGRVNHDVDGWLPGAHLGFNQQFGRWVGGAEVSLSGGDLEGSSVIGDVTTRTEISSLFLATVRLGHAFDRTLAYVKGGYASADVKLLMGDEGGASRMVDREAGFTLGAGVEHAVTNRVIVGLDYNRVDLGSAWREPDVLHVAMARLSLKFGDDAPLAMPAVLK